MNDTLAIEQTDYRIRYESCSHRIRLVFDGVTVADSCCTIIMHETRYAPGYYFPRADVRMDLLHPTDHHTHCPFKGNASYWTLKSGSRSAENVAWSYPDPLDEALPIKGYLAFYTERLDDFYEDDELRLTPSRPVTTGYGNPLTDWLLHEAWAATSPRDLLDRLAHTLLRADIPVARLWLVVRTLHPQLFSTRYSWRPDQGAEEYQISHGILQDERYLASPLVPIFEGAGGVRRRLEGPHPQLDYPILADLREEGFTDYVAMPMEFSDGQLNAISLASKQRGGFGTAALGHIYEIMPLLSRLFEVHAKHATANNLLNTYLGHQSGAKVLNGLVKRGDGEDIHAVIWFCDLRDSTPFADSMPREAFLAILNQFFEATAGAVLEHGGEVLRFIGDAVLAIFPIGSPAAKKQDGCPLTVKACAAALAAANAAKRNMAALNQGRLERGEALLRYGIGLHLGDVIYGNIGTAQRLEFSVIGAAANEAARIESLCKTLDQTVLISAQFACYALGHPLVSLGCHRLRGVDKKQEIFTLKN